MFWFSSGSELSNELHMGLGVKLGGVNHRNVRVMEWNEKQVEERSSRDHSDVWVQ